MSVYSGKKVLPVLELTELASVEDFASRRIDIDLDGKKHTYFIRPKLIPTESSRRDGKPKWAPTQFNLYPIVLNKDGSPWAEANLWLIRSLEECTHPNMSSTSSRADDLAFYLRFLEDKDIDWLDFPEQKLLRPTYRFNGYLTSLIHAQETAVSTAKRRMGTVVRFYRWLKEEGLFGPANPPWKENDHYVQFKGNYGANRIKKVTSTDVSIRSAKQHDPYDERIDDGGKLRPLLQREQEWLWEALHARGNTEMTLIHQLGIYTGARIQSILTLRVHHVLKDMRPNSEGVIVYPIGPRVGIDTKFNKELTLHIPLWLYEALQIYATSERAKRRRVRAVGGDTQDQYLFLSIRGAPLYASRGDHAHGMAKGLRHDKVGQGVRQFITTYLVPHIRAKHDPHFHYRFHDTRATYGMNLVDATDPLVNEGKITKTEQLHYVRARMGHASLATTEKYLDYRRNLKMIRVVQDGWELNLRQKAQNALRGEG